MVCFRSLANLASVTLLSAILSVVTFASVILDVVTELDASSASVTLVACSFAVLILSLAILPDVTAKLLMSPVFTASGAILAVVIAVSYTHLRAHET